MKRLAVALIFLLLGWISASAQSDDRQAYQGKAHRLDITWKVEVYLHFYGELERGQDADPAHFDFRMAQILSMARDNGDYLFADASMPVCLGSMVVNGELARTWTEKDDAVLEPRCYYLDRDNGLCRLPLVIQERAWPETLPHLVMPRSAEAQFIRDGVPYRRHLFDSDNRIEFDEERLFDPGMHVIKIDWQWRRGKPGERESHRLQGEIRFIRTGPPENQGQDGVN